MYTRHEIPLYRRGKIRTPDCTYIIFFRYRRATPSGWERRYKYKRSKSMCRCVINLCWYVHVYVTRYNRNEKKELQHKNQLKCRKAYKIISPSMQRKLHQSRGLKKRRPVTAVVVMTLSIYIIHTLGTIMRCVVGSLVWSLQQSTSSYVCVCVRGQFSRPGGDHLWCAVNTCASPLLYWWTHDSFVYKITSVWVHWSNRSVSWYRLTCIMYILKRKTIVRTQGNGV